MSPISLMSGIREMISLTGRFRAIGETIHAADPSGWAAGPDRPGSCQMQGGSCFSPSLGELSRQYAPSTV